MPTAQYKSGDSFPVQFAWRLENGDYLRAVFQAEVIDLYPTADKYLVRLTKWIAARQDDADGNTRPQEEMNQEYLNYLPKIVGQRLGLAYEADNGMALHLRLATLTGEHNFFFRFRDAPALLSAKAALE